MHLVESATPNLKCQHMPENYSGSYIGVPMIASGDLIGLLHIEWPDKTEIDKETQDLAQNVAEHLSLSISNIRLRETLRNQSIRDPLTGVFNRRFMEESLERELPRALRKKSSVGIMMMDIDHFKKFNDTFGHDAGDLVLRTLSEIFQNNVRKEDIVCRYGGEEFVIILPEANLEISQNRAEAIRKAVNELKVDL